jgi:glycosyltransferase involved in cell wall biosynthesis
VPDLAVIIPARNEAANIAAVIRDVSACLPGAGIVVVDDRSEDGTFQAASAFPGVTVLRSPISLGIGGAVQLGVRYALEKGYSRFARMDGDGQHRAESVVEMLRCAGPGTLVQGSRPHHQFALSSNWIRKAGSLYFHLLFRACARTDLPDPTSGLMCFGRDIGAHFSRFYPTDFPEIESLALLLRAGHRVVSVPVAMRTRQAGESSIGFLRGIVYMISVTMAFFIAFLRRNPYSAPLPAGGAHGG